MPIQRTGCRWQSRLFGHALWLSIGILFGRVAGFARESSLAARFGATSEADVAVVLLTIPDMLVNMLVGGALAVALIPEFKRFGAGSRSQVLFIQGSLFTSLIFVLLVAILSYFSGSLLDLVAPGIARAQYASATNLLAQVLWVIPLTTLAGVSTAYLQANDRFVVPAFGTFLYNSLLVVVILLLLDAQQPLHTLVIAILIAALLRWVSQLARVPWQPIALHSLRWRLLHGTLLMRYMQALGAGSLIILLPVIARALASEHGDGSMALFNYAHKLVEFPLGVGVSVVAVAIFPMLSRAFALGEDATRAVRVSLRIVMVLSWAMLITLYVYRELFAHLTFGWGNMTPDALAELTSLFSIGLLGLPLQGLSSLLLAVFNARCDTATPLYINAVAVALFLSIGWFLSQQYGLIGIMTSLVFVYLLILVAQILLIRQRHRISVLSLLGSVRLGWLFLLGGLLAAAASLVREAFAPGLIFSLVAALFTGILLLVVGLFVMGEGQIMKNYLAHRGR